MRKSSLSVIIVKENWEKQEQQKKRDRVRAKKRKHNNTRNERE